MIHSTVKFPILVNWLISVSHCTQVKTFPKLFQIRQVFWSHWGWSSRRSRYLMGIESTRKLKNYAFIFRQSQLSNFLTKDPKSLNTSGFFNKKGLSRFFRNHCDFFLQPNKMKTKESILLITLYQRIQREKALVFTFNLTGRKCLIKV